MMENIIREMIAVAERKKDYDLAEFAYMLMDKFALTVNCPSDWREIGQHMEHEHPDGWANEFCKLYDFAE